MMFKYFNKFPYRKLYSYQILRFFIKHDISEEHNLRDSLNGKRKMNIKEFLIKLVAVFVVIYIAIVLPLTTSIKEAVQGIDFALAKQSSKWIITGLISNPETLYVLATQELESGNKKKASMFIETAMGIIETNNTDASYKKKFYKLKDKIDSMPNAK